MKKTAPQKGTVRREHRSLRRHYPDQVQRVARILRGLSAKSTPGVVHSGYAPAQSEVKPRHAAKKHGDVLKTFHVHPSLLLQWLSIGNGPVDEVPPDCGAPHLSPVQKISLDSPGFRLLPSPKFFLQKNVSEYS
jgi:hypothetical protein